MVKEEEGKYRSVLNHYIFYRYPFIAASPDGLFDDFIVEVKCPWILRDSDPDDLSKLSNSQKANFCCVKVGNEYQLKRSHPYFCQVQAQMFCSGLTKAKFAI